MNNPGYAAQRSVSWRFLPWPDSRATFAIPRSAVSRPGECATRRRSAFRSGMMRRGIRPAPPRPPLQAPRLDLLVDLPDLPGGTAATRKPRLSTGTAGSNQPRHAARQSRRRSHQLPPRITRSVASYHSPAHHSQTLPAMSSSPNVSDRDRGKDADRRRAAQTGLDAVADPVLPVIAPRIRHALRARAPRLPTGVPSASSLRPTCRRLRPPTTRPPTTGWFGALNSGSRQNPASL